MDIKKVNEKLDMFAKAVSFCRKNMKETGILLLDGNKITHYCVIHLKSENIKNVLKTMSYSKFIPVVFRDDDDDLHRDADWELVCARPDYGHISDLIIITPNRAYSVNYELEI